MANSSVAHNIPQSCDILRDLPSKLTSDDIVAVYDLGNSTELVFAEFTGFSSLVYSGFFEYLFGGVPTYAYDISQRNPYRLFVGNVNTHNTRHFDSYSNCLSFQRILNQPWRCLWRGFGQITRRTPLRRTILHLSHIRFTELLTFIFDICFQIFRSRPIGLSDKTRPLGSMPKDYSTSVEIIRRHFNNDGIAGENPNKVHSHLPGDVCHNLVAVFQFHLEHCIGQSISHLSL
jgi:hypothetical protein